MADQLPILLDDAHLIAVDKPAGMSVIPGRDGSESVRHQLQSQLNTKLRPVHRLDRDTTGVLLFARTLEAQRHLSHQFQNNRVRKVYHALVAGRPLEDAGEIDAMLAIDPKNAKRMAVVKKQGKPAQTAWQVIERFRQHALIEARPRTGKTHQIRVHLQHIGLPLTVDRLYQREGRLMLSDFKRGYRPNRREERPLIDRLTLHAHQLTFEHPDGQEMTVTSEWPKDFRTAVTQLRRFG